MGVEEHVNGFEAEDRLMGGKSNQIKLVKRSDLGKAEEYEKEAEEPLG